MASTFPAHVLGIKAEILLNGIWTDISLYVQQRAVINITNMGRPDWTSTIQPAQMTLTLNNRDGRFTPKLAGKAYYPYITRNVKIRLSVDSTSMTAVAYTGYRFWGEVTTWPTKWDSTGADVYCDIVCSGIWRRLSQSKIPLGSPYLRYYQNLTGTSVPQGYWPMEDGSGSLVLVSVGAASNATFTGSPSLASCVTFRGSDGIVTLNAGFITCTVPAGGTPTNNCTRFLLSVPAAGDSASGTTNWNIIEAKSAGTVDKFEVYLNYAGTLLIQLRNAAGTVVQSATTTTNVKGVPYLVSMELTPSAPNVAWAVRLIKPGDGVVVESKTGTYNTASIGAIQTIKLGRASALMDTSVGHVSATYAVPAIVTAATALNGFNGELALDRFTRICTEEGIATEVIGTAAASALMGPQQNMTITQLLQTIEDTDCGMLYEARTSFALGYRTLKSMADQVAALTLNYHAGLLSGELSPIYDDQFTKNNITCVNWNGYTVQSLLASGGMSVLDPPNGIGSGYEYSRNVVCRDDSQVGPIATWMLNVGSVDENRIPNVTLDMRRSELAALFATAPGMRIGDFLSITNPPAGFLSAGAINQLAWGYSETLNAFEWVITFNTVPESPYVTGFTPGTVQTHQLPGGTSVSSQGDFVKSIAALIANGNITPAMLNEGITSVSLGGIRTTIAVAGPTDPAPNAGDIWINSSTGQLSRWSGAAWAPITFDASAVIQAASIESAQIAADTIVGSNIAGGTITAGLLAAGIIVTGIVNATDIFANSYTATSSAGEFLAYDTDPPSAGHLINAIAGIAGTDPSGNPFPKGLYSQQVTLLNQAVAPPAFSGASVFYSSVAGRPRYLSSPGVSSVIERSEVNIAQWTVGNTTTPSIISAPLSYAAGEGSQSSEFEIEIDGIITTANVGQTAQTLTFALNIDGSVPSGAGPVTWGAVFMAAGNVTFAYTICARLSIVTTGASGTCNIGVNANISRRAANMGSQTNPLASASGGEQGFSKAFDSTSGHTLQIYVNWGGNSTGQQLTTYRTRIARRM